MADLDKIKNIVVVMMRGCSFDRMLGYLSLPPFNRQDVDGQRLDLDWLKRFTNFDNLQTIQPFLATNPYTMPEDFDPPHERRNVAAQIDPRQDESYPLNGFVRAIPPQVSNNPVVRKMVMSYFGAEQVPINDFFAKNFTICDRWFSSLPASTQANRLMAMSGFTLLDESQTRIPNQELVYDWLNARGVSWWVYHQGIPFFALMSKWLPSVLLNDKFRGVEQMGSDLLNAPPDQLPQVIFVEPTYQDAPHLGASTDDHAPAGISGGQGFLMQIYKAVTASKTFWNRALMVVIYDEHGGFFDHVQPPRIPTNPPDGARWSVPFESLGVRTPAFVISPFVQQGATNHNLLDHTSVLKLLGEKFGNGSYSPIVDTRPVSSVSSVLDFTSPIIQAPTPPHLDYYFKAMPIPTTGVTSPPLNTVLQIAFFNVLSIMREQGVDSNHPKFGKLVVSSCQIELNRTDTLVKSSGRVPDKFFQDAVLSEKVIDLASSSRAVPTISPYSSFISHSTKDDEFARRLHSRMREANMRVWFAPEDLKGGKKLHEQLFEAIQIHDRLLLVLSEHSIQSAWVITEIRKAREVEKKEKRRKLFPIRLTDFETLRDWTCFDADTGKDLAVEVREYFIPDFSNWKDHDAFESAFARLKKDLEAENPRG